MIQAQSVSEKVISMTKFFKEQVVLDKQIMQKVLIASIILEQSFSFLYLGAMFIMKKV